MACKKKMMLGSVSKLIQPSISAKLQATQYFNALKRLSHGILSYFEHRQNYR